MKNIFKILLSTLVLVFTVACNSGSKSTSEKLVVGVSPVPHKQIIELVKDDLKAKNIDLEIVEFNDYVQPNIALKDKSLDANFFQHVPYMEEFNKSNNMEMVSVGAIHLEPLKVYSKKIKNLSELKENDEVLIPNDPTNRGRSLILLDNAGVIKLKDKNKLDSDVNDIVENSKNLKITSLNSEQIGPRLAEVAIAVINTNNAIASNVDSSLAIFVESKESPYANVVSVLKGRENETKIVELVKALQSEKVKKFIENTYKGEVIPAF